MGVYGPAIVGFNLLLLICSTVLIYLGSMLITFYLLPTLSFVHGAFAAVPYLIIIAGGGGLIGGLLGVGVGATASRPGLIVHAILLTLVFITMLASVFTAYDLRSKLENKILDKMSYNLHDFTTNYWKYPAERENWDELQRNYQCCGLQQMNTGYKDWQSGAVSGHVPASTVPDSCCLYETTGCGKDIGGKLHPYLEINTHGCLAILDGRMTRDIEPLLLGYLISGTLLALLQMVCIVMSSAYCAALTRRVQREKERLMILNQGEKRSLYHFTDSGAPSTRGSKSMVDEDRISSTSYNRADFKATLYTEPSNETGTCI
ncbi:tetraspanin-3 [Eurytemora carolleeae]|uniref:tetraspanin-3 n=1 Tax=Eurytemora carolleeae TaxID=1294199 RepID=UPI000C7719FE|nr:tetraspanin-3 [Eurytemora carolleeae]|eukprot:XP_023331651.1 tetraspanin-3-like [Eurytemora affinis]